MTLIEIVMTPAAALVIAIVVASAVAVDVAADQFSMPFEHTIVIRWID